MKLKSFLCCYSISVVICVLLFFANSALYAQSRNEIEITVLFDGTPTFDTDPLGSATPTGVAPEPHTPGLDASANNLVVRTFDQFAFRIDWNINEADATNVQIRVDLPSALAAEWTTDDSGTFAGCSGIAFSNNNRTFVCDLGDQAEGSNGVIRPVATLLEVNDNTTFGAPTTLLTAQDAVGVTDDIDQQLTVSELTRTDIIKNTPIISSTVAGTGGQQGRVFLYPISILDFSQATTPIRGVGPINDAAHSTGGPVGPVTFYDHIWGFTPDADVEGPGDIARLATQAELDAAELADGSSFAGDACGFYGGSGDFVAAPAAGAGFGGGNAIWSCAADASSAAAGYGVVRIDVENFVSRPFAPNLASGAANDPEAPMILAGQIAIWVPETEIQEEIADPANISSISAELLNSISAQDGNTPVTAIEGAGAPIEPTVEGTSGPNSAGGITNNSVPAPVGAIPQVGGSGTFQFNKNIFFRPGPLKLVEVTQSNIGGNNEPRLSYDFRSVTVGGTGAQLPGSNSTRHNISGADLIGTVARGSLVTLHSMIGSQNQNDDNGSNGFIYGCTALDNTHYDLVPFGDIQVTELVPETAPNSNNLANVVSVASETSNSGILAHAYYGAVSGGNGAAINLPIFPDPDGIVPIIEFTNAPLQTINGLGTGSFGVADDGLTCNDADAGPAGWIAADDPNLATAFDTDSDGRFEGITRMRVRTSVPVEFGNYRGISTPNVFQSRTSGLQVFLQAQVKTDINAQAVAQELFALQSYAYGMIDPLTGAPNLEIFPGDTTAPDSCRPLNGGVWTANTNTDFESATGWCNNTFVDDGVDSNDIADDVDWDDRSVTNGFGSQPFLTEASGTVISIVQARLGLSKTNRDGVNDIVDNGQIVEFVLTPRVTGSNQEALTNIFLIDNLDSRFEFVPNSFVIASNPGNSSATGSGANCAHNGVNPGGQIVCRFSSADPAAPGPGVLPPGLPGGWSDEVRFQVTVTGAIANPDSRTVLPNTGDIRSSAIGPWDPNTGNFTDLSAIAASSQRIFSSAFAFMPLPSDEAVIAKILPTQQGSCDVIPAGFSGTLTEWQVRCQQIDLNGNVTFDLTIENEGNTALPQIEFVDVFPFTTGGGDGVDPETASNTPNQTGSTPTNGDGRTPASDFTGTVSFVGVTANSIPAGSSLVTWVTGDAPTSVSRDPARALADTTWCDATLDAGTPGTVQNGVGVNADCPATNSDVTAVYVLLDGGAGLVPDATASVRLELDTEGAQCDDVWTNTFGARTSAILLPIRSNDVSVQVNCVALGSTVFLDVNNNGVQDPLETGIVGVPVQVFRAGDDPTSDTPVNSTTTGPDGSYLFSGLSPDDYFVYIPTPPAASPTSSTDIATSTADNRTDGDDNGQQLLSGGPVQSPDITLARGTEPTLAAGNEGGTNNAQDDDAAFPGSRDQDGDMTVDFGFYTPVSIGSYVWQDADGDGVQDAGENPIPNASVTLLVENPAAPGVFIPAVDFNGVTVVADITGADGLYEFENLPPGNYRVQVTPPAGFVPSPVQDGGNNSDTLVSDQFDSNINTSATGVPAGTFQSGTFTLISGTEPIESDAAAGDAQDGVSGSASDLNGNNTVDFGFIAPVSIGSFIFNDADGDGQQDVGEPGIANTAVSLFVDNGAGVFVPATDLAGNPVTFINTGADGLYEFTNLPPGNYQVQATPPSDFVPSPVQTETADDNTVNDSNVLSTPVSPGVYRSPVMTLTSGGEPNETGAFNGDTQDGAANSVDDLSGNMTVDMGFVVPVSIGSYVWEDLDVDGVQDASEPALEDATVALLVDNGSGVFIAATDINGNTVTNITTGADGLYEFDNLPPGDYRVRVTPPTGFEATPTQDGANNSDTLASDELDSNINTSASGVPTGTFESGTFTLTSLGEPTESDAADGDSQDGTLGSNSDLSGNNTVDFGFVAPMSIGSFVWEDLDGDGVQDTGEPGVENAVVSLLVDNGSGTFITATDINGTAITNVTTGANGLYEFDNLPPGDYRVRVTPPAGYDASPVQDGANNSDTTPADELDSNINTSATGVPAGTFESGTFTLSSGDEPEESDAAAGDNQDGTAGGLADLNGNNTIDFGFVTPVSIGSFVWNDADGDGVQDSGEAGIAGAQVTLFRETTPGNFVQVTADLDGNVFGAAGALTTGVDGLYEFDNLLAGNYKVRVTPPAGSIPSLTQDGADNSNTLASDELDSNINISATGLPAGTYESGVFTLSNGTEPTESDAAAGDNQDGTTGSAEDLSGNNTVDFGFITPVSIGSYVWEDLDVDGVQDGTEPAIENAVVSLLVDNGTGTFIAATDINGDPVTNTTTGADGLYEFDNLPPGDYRVRVTPPAGFEATPTQDGADNSDTTAADELDSNINLSATGVPTGTFESGTFTLTSLGEPNESTTTNVDGQDGAAGSNEDLSGNMTVDFGFVAPMSIGSFVWQDTDGDGVQDAGEPGIQNAVVSLLVDNGAGVFVAATDINGNAVTNVTTGANGLYEFDNLPPGDYRVRVTPPVGFEATPVQDGANNSDTLASDELDSNINTTVTGVPAGTFESGTFTLSSGDEPNESDAAAGDNQDGTANSAADLNGNNTIDFGFIAPVSIGSFIWNDANGDGVQDAGELGIENATVALLVEDPNNAGVFIPATDLDGNTVTNVTTLADGLYEFSDLPPGNYKVRVTPPSDFEPTPTQNGANNSDTTTADELDSNINLTATGLPTGTYESGEFTLTSGGEPNESDAAVGDTQDGSAGSNTDLSGNNTVDFGFVQPVSIGSYAWEDLDVDGVQDAGEPGIADVTLSLVVDNGSGVFVPAVDINGDPVTNVVTGVDGLYEFDNLPPGDYRVRLVPPAGFEPSPVQDGVDNSDTTPADELDSNINTAATGLPADTFESGTFTLTSLGEPNESDTAAGDSQDGTAGSNADLSGNNTIDFGLVSPVSLGSFVWNDLNGDGIQQANEPPIAGAQVTLLVDDGTGTGTLVPATDINGVVVSGITVGPDGLYHFENLPNGEYVVELTAPSGFASSPVQTFDPNDDSENDSNIAEDLGGNVYRSASITLDSFTEPVERGTFSGDAQDGTLAEDVNGNMTLDFGFVELASLGNRVWLDLDMDGVQDANEEGIANAVVNLFEDTDGNGVIDGAELTIPVASVATGPNGEYVFTDLIPGVVYITGVDVTTLPVGLEQTFDEGDGVDATDSLSAPIVLEPREFHETADFGYAPPAGLGAIGDTIWIDEDDDGNQDPGEPGIAGVTVSLTPPPAVDLGNGLGVPITTVTDENGKYLFPNLPLNEAYIVEVDIATLPLGYTASISGLGDPDVRDGNSDPSGADNQTVVVITADAPVNLDADFGYLPPADQNNSVGDTLWIDVDEDGNGPVGAGDGSDANEQPLPGVTVALVDEATGAVIATTITDANGQYLFTGIPDGVYEVRVTDQNNVLAGLAPTADGDDPANPGLFVPVTPNVSLVDLDSGGASVTPVVDVDQDFGYVDTSTNAGDGTIGDTIFFDANDSGFPEAGEGIEGVTVQLFDPGPDGIIGNGDDVLIGSTQTDENGNYLFTGLDTSNRGPNPGTDYRVVVDTSTLPNGGDGWTNSVDPDTVGTGDSESVTTLTAADPVDLERDFGYVSEDNNSLSGTLWPDTDGDGELVEVGRFEGVTIELRDQDGNVIQTTTTDANGNYEFTNLPDGVYTVVVTDEDNVLNGFEHTDSPNGLTDTSDNTSKDDTGYTVDLDSAGINPDPVSDATGDFGYQPTVTNPISLASFKAEQTEQGVLIEWTTQTEAGNLGFYVYAQVNGQWQTVSDLIGGLGDSTSLQRYQISVADFDARAYAISDIDLYGQETMRGPFMLGRQYGVDEAGKLIDWDTINGEQVDAPAASSATPLNSASSVFGGEAQSRQDKEAKKRQQMQRRNEERKQRRVGKPLSQSLQPNVLPTEEAAMNTHAYKKVSATSTWAVLLSGVLNALIPSAHAADQHPEDVLNLLVKESGVYQVSHQQLIDFGLDIDGEPLARIALTSGGQAVPIEVTGSIVDPAVFGAGSTIQFVGHGLDTLYTDTNVYTLRLDSDMARRITSDDRRFNGGQVSAAYLATKRYSPQVDYSFISPNRQDPWYAERLLSTVGATASTDIQLELDYYQPAADIHTQAKLAVNVWGASDLPTAKDHDVSVAINGVEIASKTFGGLKAQSIQANVTAFQQGSNTVTVSLPLSSGQPYDLVHLDAVEISYPRALVADGQQLQFKASGGAFVVRGFTSNNITVYRELNGQVSKMDNAIVSGSCSANAPGCAVLFSGVSEEANYQVFVEQAVRQAELSLLPLEENIQSGQAQYLIISHGDFIDAQGQPLERLAAELSTEYSSVDIVDADSIYAQYGDYRFEPQAIRHYIRDSQARRGTTTVLLVGGDVYDYRQFQNQQARSFIPSLYASTDGAVNFAPVDAKYADTDNDNVPDLVIARLPVRTPSELETLLSKREQYLDRSYSNTAVFAVDGYDQLQQYSFAQDADRVNQSYFEDWQVTQAYVDNGGVAQARQSLVNAINEGQTLTAFFGHSSTNQWSFSGLFSGSDAGNLNNQGKPTVVTQWGCWNTYYVDPAEESMGHRFMVEGDRGAVSVMGASTLTKADNERRLAELVFARLLNQERLGEAILNAKRDYAQENPNGLDVLLGWTLLGLPELTVY